MQCVNSGCDCGGGVCIVVLLCGCGLDNSH